MEYRGSMDRSDVPAPALQTGHHRFYIYSILHFANSLKTFTFCEEKEKAQMRQIAAILNANILTLHPDAPIQHPY